MDNVRQSRLWLLEGIDNAILRLMTPEEKTLMHKPGGTFDLTHIAQLLKIDQLNAAIMELAKLKAQVIKTFGPEAADRVEPPALKLQEVPSPTYPMNSNKFRDSANLVLDRMSL